MVKFCTSCGTANTPDALYCAKCGTAMPGPIAEAVVEQVQAPIKGQPLEISPVADIVPLLPDAPEPERNWLVILAVVGSLLLIGGAYYWLFVADDIKGSSLSTAATAESAPAAAQVQLFTITNANIRDRPTTSGSSILGKLPRGSAISGVLKVSEDGIEWLELSEGKGFVATVNLVELQPPELVQSLGDRSWTADSRIDVYAAGIDSELLDSVSAGTVLKLSGLTANGALEVKLPDGRLGYILQGKEILARLGGKPIAIAFNPQTCNFGSELGAEFAKIGTRLKAQWQALEDKEFADNEARDKAYSATEGKSSYVKLSRSFEGLTLTAIGQHYESQSLYFADPPAKVIEVFRANGFRIDGNGNFPSTELYAGISATRGEGAAYGKSELGCGV
jgi:zinc-ribbon domain